MKAETLYQKYYKEHAEKPTIDSALIKRLLSYLRPYRFNTSISLFFLFAARIIDALIPIYIGFVTNKIILSGAQTIQNKENLFDTILQDTFWLFLLLIASYLFDLISIIIKSRIGQKALYTMRMQVYDKILHLPLSFFDKNAVGKLMTRTIHDVEQINQMFTESVIPLLGSLLLFVCMFFGIFWVDWRAGLTFVMILPAVGWLTNRFRHFQRYCYNLIRNIVSAMNTFVQEHLMGASVIRNFGLQKKEKRLFDELNQDYCSANIETIHHFSYFFAGIDFLQSFSLIAVFVMLTVLTPAGFDVQVGTFFTFSLYALMLFRPLVDLAERYNVLQSAVAAAERIFVILDTPKEKDTPSALTLTEIHSIAFENVWFAYDSQNWILKGLSFEIKQGESVAFVGYTGAGKTTIMSLLLRFYIHQKGEIKINGHPIQNYSLSSLRKQFSIVLQDPILFSGSLFDNIALYHPEIKPEQVESVIKYLGFNSMISRHSEGLFYTLIERGENLSMGEKQLVSLARAVVQESSALILDEATANIDSATEQIIQSAMKKILANKTALVIAHRLSTIRDAQRIIVIHDGKVAETGTHATLLEKKGIYEKLHRLQFQRM